MPDEANQQQVFHLYDDYCHGRIERREFFSRCAATEGFLALAPDGLVPVGGYPGNDDDGRSLQIHYAENDNWVNGTRQDYEAGLQASGLPFEMHTYPGTGHGLHNNSTPRYVEAASDLAWQRTMAWFHRYL